MQIFRKGEKTPGRFAADCRHILDRNESADIRPTMPTFTLGEYLQYRDRMIEKNERPLRLELWRLREMAREENARKVREINSHHKTPMPKISPESKPRKYRKVRLSDTPTMAGNRVDNTGAVRPKKSKNRLELPSGNYLLSLPKNAGVPLVVNSEGNVDVKLSLAFLDFYRLAIASGNPRKEDK